MPYVKKDRRRKFGKIITHADTIGELNYEITNLLMDYVENQGGLCYDNVNAIVGVLECVKLELYRRVVAPYEDDKKTLNGDVYIYTKEQ